MNTMTPSAPQSQGGFPSAGPDSPPAPAASTPSDGPNPWKVATLLVGSVIAIGAIVSVAFTGFVGGQFSRYNTTVPITEKVLNVSVSAEIADVRVERSAGITQAQVRYDTLGFGRDEQPGQMISIEVVDGTLRVTVPSRSGGAFWNRDYVSDIRVELPADDAALESVRVDGNVGSVRVSTDVTDVDVTTQVGDIRIETETKPETVRAVTEVGTVRVLVPTGTYSAVVESDIGGARVSGIVVDPAAPRSILVTSNVGDVRVDAVGG
ncbi:hypothetical protein [Klugiella xanthotipulae]|uniref:hypothetical protein n=1 Tax=Klugiella xanthotipulae TaxID=244735 RepID=UPI001150319E|nr:hypothetical protein [Klugiella xanthotipulae]